MRGSGSPSYLCIPKHSPSHQPHTMLHRSIAPVLRSFGPSIKTATKTTSQRSWARPVSPSAVRSYATSSPSSSKDASGHATAATSDPGYHTTRESAQQAPPARDAAPSRDSDPFPLPGDPRLEGLSLSSKHQLEHLTQEPGFPSRVPGREPGQESKEVKVARLKYQIRHRGILETDLLLSTFAKTHLEGLSEAELDEFDLLLDEPDWDIFYWMTERKEVPDRWRESFETKDRLGWRLRIHTKNENKETRSMPAL